MELSIAPAAMPSNTLWRHKFGLTVILAPGSMILVIGGEYEIQSRSSNLPFIGRLA